MGTSFKVTNTPPPPLLPLENQMVSTPWLLLVVDLNSQSSLHSLLPALKKKEVKTKPKKPGKGKLTSAKKPTSGNTRAIGTDCSGEKNFQIVFAN